MNPTVKPTGFVTLIWAGIVGLAFGIAIAVICDINTWARPVPFGTAMWLLIWVIWLWMQRRRSGSLQGQQAVRSLYLSKAASWCGVLLIAWFGFWVCLDVSKMFVPYVQQRVIHCVLVVLAGGLLVWRGLSLERSLRLPPPEDT